MTIKLFHDLNQEWSVTVDSLRLAQALGQWKSSESVSRGVPGPPGDRQPRAHDPDRSRRDGVLAALIRLGREDSAGLARCAPCGDARTGLHHPSVLARSSL